jgi:hypothetical protein
MPFADVRLSMDFTHYLATAPPHLNTPTKVQDSRASLREARGSSMPGFALVKTINPRNDHLWGHGAASNNVDDVLISNVLAPFMISHSDFRLQLPRTCTCARGPLLRMSFPSSGLVFGQL